MKGHKLKYIESIIVAVVFLSGFCVGVTHAACPAGSTGNLQYNSSSACAGLNGTGLPLSNGSSAPTLFPMADWVDGTTYAFSATGIQNAINAGIGGGVGTPVMLPATESLTNNEISMTSGVTMKSDQCVVGQGHGQTFLSYSGSGPAFKFPGNSTTAGTHDACLIGVTIFISSPTSGQSCIEIDGDNADGHSSHDILIRDVLCQYNSLTAGTTGVKFVGTGTTLAQADVSLIHVEDTRVLNAATAYTVDDSEQDFFNDDIVDDGYTAPAVTFGAKSALIHWDGGRIAGSGTTGDAFNFVSGEGKITVDTVVDSGAADCFGDTNGSHNFLKCQEAGGTITLGTIDANSTAYLDNVCQNGC